MKTIEERAKEYAPDPFLAALERKAYIAGVKEQKAIDKANYKQGYNDAIKMACNVFCHTGCPHKTDFYNCLNDKCDTWKIFKRMMEEQL